MTDIEKTEALIDKHGYNAAIYFIDNLSYKNVMVLYSYVANYFHKRIIIPPSYASMYKDFACAYDNPDKVIIIGKGGALALNGELYIGDRCIVADNSSISEVWLHHFTVNSACFSYYEKGDGAGRYISRTLTHRKVWKI